MPLLWRAFVVRCASLCCTVAAQVCFVCALSLQPPRSLSLEVVSLGFNHAKQEAKVMIVLCWQAAHRTKGHKHGVLCMRTVGVDEGNTKTDRRSSCDGLTKSSPPVCVCCVGPSGGFLSIHQLSHIDNGNLQYWNNLLASVCNLRLHHIQAVCVCKATFFAKRTTFAHLVNVDVNGGENFRQENDKL